MSKLAVFVEGQTEQILVEKIIREIANPKSIAVECVKLLGGAGNTTRSRVILAQDSAKDKKYFISIFDCGCDNKVAADVRDQYDSLVKNGYTKIIGIRDVYPEFVYSQIPKLRSLLGYGIKTIPIKVDFILGVMEIEAWFIAEYTHFQRIHSSLDLEAVRDALAMDPSRDDVQLLPKPSESLDKVYSKAGEKYSKARKHVQRTVGAVDCAHLYLEVGTRVKDLGRFCTEIDQFLI